MKAIFAIVVVSIGALFVILNDRGAFTTTPSVELANVSVRGQAALTKHPHIQYVNDVDEGLVEGLRQVQDHEDKEGMVPQPPEFHNHNPGGDHVLNRIPLPDKFLQLNTAAKKPNNNNNNNVIPSPEAEVAEDPKPAATTNNKLVNTLQEYRDRFHKKHDLMQEIHEHETEIHDRLEDVQNQQKDVRDKESAVDDDQASIHDREVAVAQHQSDVASKEQEIAEYLRQLQEKIASEKEAIEENKNKQFAKVVNVEHDILDKIAQGAVVAAAKRKRHSVRVNVNSPNGVAAPVHVKVSARKLGDDGDVEININRDIWKKISPKSKHNRVVVAKKRMMMMKKSSRGDVKGKKAVKEEKILKTLTKIDEMISRTNKEAKNAAQQAKEVSV